MWVLGWRSEQSLSVPTGQAGDDHLFGQIPQLVDDDVALLIVGGDEGADAVGAGQ